MKRHYNEIKDYVKARLFEIMMEAYDVRSTNDYWFCLRKAFALIQLCKYLEEKQMLDEYGFLYRGDLKEYINNSTKEVENQTCSKKISTIHKSELNLLYNKLF